jgi:hypothetical protein
VSKIFYSSLGKEKILAGMGSTITNHDSSLKKLEKDDAELENNEMPKRNAGVI